MVEQPQDRYITVGGVRLHYLDWGGNADSTVLLLHGFTSNAHAWSPFVDAGYLSPAKHRILALDQRGHGDSDHTRDYTIRAFTGDISAFARELGLEQYSLIGHSMGARHAMAYAGDHSASLRRLVLVDFGPEMERDGASQVRSRAIERPAGFASIEKAVDFLRQVYPDRSDADLEHNARHALRLNYAGRLVWKHDPEVQWISGAFGLTEVPYIWEQVRRIQSPTLVVRGEQSNILGPTVLARMLEAIPGSRSVEIAGATHAVPQDQPAAFWREVNAFLD